MTISPPYSTDALDGVIDVRDAPRSCLGDVLGRTDSVLCDVDTGTYNVTDTTTDGLSDAREEITEAHGCHLLCQTYSPGPPRLVEPPAPGPASPD